MTGSIYLLKIVFVSVAWLLLSVGCAVRANNETEVSDLNKQKEFVNYSLVDNWSTCIARDGEYLLVVRFPNGSTNNDVVRMSFLNYSSKTVWTEDVTLPDEIFASGTLDEVLIFKGRDKDHPIIVVTYRPFSGGGDVIHSDNKLAAYEMNYAEHTIRFVLGLRIGQSTYGVDHFVSTKSFFDVAVNEGQVTFITFERDKSMEKVSAVRKFILKDEGFVAQE